MNPVITPVQDGLVIFRLSDEDRKRLRNIKLMNGGGQPEEDIIFHRMCIQQAVTVLTERPEVWDAPKLGRELNKLDTQLANLDWDDPEYERITTEIKDLQRKLHLLEPGTQPICVSQAINNAMVHLNDRELTAQQRGRLKPLVEEILNTCPVKRTVRQFKTKPDRVEERRFQPPGYKAAEALRRRILDGVEGNIHEMSFNDAIKRIRYAASLYRVTEAGLPGGADNPIVAVTAKES